MQDTNDKRRVTVAIDASVHEKGKELARRERRDFSAFLSCLIEREFVTKGANPVAQEEKSATV